MPPEIRTDTTSSGSVQLCSRVTSRVSGWPALQSGHRSARVQATQIGSALTVIEPSPETTSPAGCTASQATSCDSCAALPDAVSRDPPPCPAS